MDEVLDMNHAGKDVATQLEADARQQRVRQVLDEYLARRAAGELITREELLERNAELREEIAAELLKLEVIDRARIDAKSNQLVAQHLDQAVIETVLLIHCPHCQTGVALEDESSQVELRCSSCGQHLFLIGPDVIEEAPRCVGRFELVEKLGSGSFGTVWRARDSTLDREVAVKLPRRRLMDAVEIEEVVREARVAAKLRHRHIVTVHEVGQDGESVYIVSDLIRGVTLREWAEDKPMTFTAMAELCCEIAEALDHAHESGIVHRDLKPANILIDQQGAPHLTDFGLAKQMGDEIAMTTDGHILGTPGYMSPEQARGEARTCDRRSDVYSLGVILFQLLTSELPFRGNMSVLPHKVIHDEPPSPRRMNRYVPRDLETICLKCLEKDRRKRYQTARELANELTRYCNGEPIRARPIGTHGRIWRWCRRQPRIASLVAAILGLLLLIPTLTTWGYVRERELRRRTDEAFNGQRKLLRFISSTDTVQDYSQRLDDFDQQKELARLFSAAYQSIELTTLRDQLNGPDLDASLAKELRRELVSHADRYALQAWVDSRYAESDRDEVFAWFLQDNTGLQFARAPIGGDNIGHNYAWRSYFHGGEEDDQDHGVHLKHAGAKWLQKSHLSAAFFTELTKEWVVAVSTPVFADNQEKTFLGVVGVFLYIERPGASTDVESQLGSANSASKEPLINANHR